MRKAFPGYYRPTHKELKALWDESIFVLDANVLLDLYRYSSETSKELLEILKTYEERLWLPHQAAIEFHRNRLKVISDQSAAYEKVRRMLEKNSNSLQTDFATYKRHPVIRVESILAELSPIFDRALHDLSAQAAAHPAYLEDDPILSAITDLFSGRVGQPFSESELSGIYKEGEKRYSEEIPPGYLDSKEKQGNKKYGDLVLWRQVLRQAKANKSSVVLITDDKKDDWWRRSDGKIIGPRPELVEEFMQEVERPFYMYKTDQFIEHAQKRRQRKVPTAALDEVREVQLQEEIDQTRKYLNRTLLRRRHQFDRLMENRSAIDAEIEALKGEIVSIEAKSSRRFGRNEVSEAERTEALTELRTHLNGRLLRLESDRLLNEHRLALLQEALRAEQLTFDRDGRSPLTDERPELLHARLQKLRRFLDAEDIGDPR